VKFSLATCGFLFLLCACSGGGGGGGLSTAPPPVQTEGVYDGTLMVGNSAYDISIGVDSAGLARMVENSVSPAVVVAPSAPIVVDGAGNIAVAATAYALSGVTLDNGKSTESVSFQGAVTAGQGITGTYSDAAGNTGTFTATFASTALSTALTVKVLAGLYSFTSYNTLATPSGSLTLNSDGTLIATDNAACTYAGTYTIPDANNAVFDFSMTSSCSTGGAIQGIAVYAPASGQASAVIKFLGANATLGLYLIASPSA
jgi:hypothetical protein